MSEYSSPISVAFELQRNALKGTHEAVENGVRAQKQFNDAVIESFGPARDVSNRNADLARMGVDTYFDAIESVVPAGSGVADVREMVDEQLELLEESHLDVIDQLETGFEENADSSVRLLDEFLEALENQVTSLLEAHEGLEGQTVEALEGLEDGIEELQSEIEAHGEEIQSQLEAQANAIQSQLEDVTENVQGTATETSDLTA